MPYVVAISFMPANVIHMLNHFVFRERSLASLKGDSGCSANTISISSINLSDVISISPRVHGCDYGVIEILTAPESVHDPHTCALMADAPFNRLDYSFIKAFGRLR
jgi:hypothetical protein